MNILGLLFCLALQLSSSNNEFERIISGALEFFIKSLSFSLQCMLHGDVQSVCFFLAFKKSICSVILLNYFVYLIYKISYEFTAAILVQ